MYDPNDSYEDLDDLLSQVDELLLGDDPDPEAFAFDPQWEDEEYEDEEDEEDDGVDFDPDEYAPADDGEDDVLMVYRNFSNGYGANIRNFSNGYGTGTRTEAPQPATPAAIPAYNADFRRAEKENASQSRQPGDTSAPEPTVPAVEKVPARNGDLPRREKKRKSPRRRGCGCGCGGGLAVLGAVVLVCMLIWNGLFVMPKSEHTIGQRKSDTATVLLCGTDYEGMRTDTMMLLYLSGSEKRVGLLSLPRDTYTITSAGNGAKLNSAYGRNGTGAEGMEGLLDYVQEIIGYRPDGYILVGMELVPRLVDLMGGVTVEVPMTFDLDGAHLDAGMQHLDGNQVLQLLRYREGYAMQDLGRVEVQRAVISACMEQWLTPAHLGQVDEALALVQDHCLTNLETGNYLWMAKTAIVNLDRMTTDTLPGYADYIGGVSYYILNRGDVAELINASYNPYREEISVENLKIAG